MSQHDPGCPPWPKPKDERIVEVERLKEQFSTLTRADGLLRAEIERLKQDDIKQCGEWLRERETLRTLVRRAAESGPGCFYCDVEEGHTADCEAAAALEDSDE